MREIRSYGSGEGPGGGNLPAYSTTAFSTAPPATLATVLPRLPAPPGAAPQRARASEAARPAPRREPPAQRAKATCVKRRGLSGTVAPLWHTRRRGAGAVAGRDAGPPEGTTSPVVQREPAAGRPTRCRRAARPPPPGPGAGARQAPAPPRAGWPPRASAPGGGHATPDERRRRPRRRLLGGQAPGPTGAGPPRASECVQSQTYDWRY